MVQRAPWLLLAAGLSACGGGGPAPAPAGTAGAAAEPYDLVIAGGRVIDPESGLDAVRHVGVRGGAVAAVSASPLAGTTTVDAAGLVVAPGFIDLHAHGQDPVSNRFQAMDGVTTALELEIGAFPVGRWYARRRDVRPHPRLLRARARRAGRRRPARPPVARPAPDRVISAILLIAGLDAPL